MLISDGTSAVGADLDTLPRGREDSEVLNNYRIELLENDYCVTVVLSGNIAFQYSVLLRNCMYVFSLRN